MNNFHFNPTSNRSVHLMKEYEEMTRQLDEKKKMLEKKNLELEFYQDKDYVNSTNSKPNVGGNNSGSNVGGRPQNRVYQNLADEIMNDLLFENKSKRQEPTQSDSRNYQQQPQMNRVQQNNNLYQQKKNFNPNNELSENYNNNDNSNNYNYSNNNNRNQNPNNYPNPQRNQQQPPFVPRQNNFIQQNKRQLDKQKLQNQSQNQENPFIPKTQQLKRSLDTKEQKPIINERQLQKIKLQDQSSQEQNPFWGENRNRSQQRNINQNKTPPNYQQYENVREKEKERLQQQLHKNKDFNIYERPTSPNQMPAQKDTQGQNVSKKAAFDNRYSNPFVKDEEYLKQMREEQQREYRRALEEQKKIDEERKRMEKQKVKEEKYAFNSYEPGTVKNTSSTKQIQQTADMPIKSPSLSVGKKVDPNGKPSAYNYEEGSKKVTLSADMDYMKMKATELKESFNKGRIMHDQYVSQVKKLADYYKVDYRELVDRRALGEEEELPWIGGGKDKRKEEVGRGQEEKRLRENSNEKQAQSKYQNTNQKYNIVENEQSLERYPDSQLSQPRNEFSREPTSAISDPYAANYSLPQSYGQHYPNNANIYTQNLSANQQQYGLASTSFLQQMPGVDYDLMRKMFEEMKALRNDYTKSLEKEKTFLQDTFMKFLANGMMQTQLQQNQSQPHQQAHLHVQSQPYGQRNADSSPKPQKKHPNILTQNSQLNFSESVQLNDKSLSGVANKIPFYSNSVNRSNNTDPSFVVETPQNNTNKAKNKKIQQQPAGKNQETVEQFFSKPYKCKKFKKFPILVDVNQSSMQIPCLSNFFALKNGKEVVNKLFEEDLMIMKKLQREKDVEKLRNRVGNQLSYGNQSSSLGAQQSSSIIQQHQLTKQTVSYGNPPSYANYGDTFSGSKNAAQFVVQTEEKKVVVTTQSNNFEEYENYSRSKERQVKSAHQQNHRTYKKAEQSLPDNAFLKRHDSKNEENLPDFADQSDIKARSPVYYSPRLNTQILEQDEYQTAQKSMNQQLLESEFYGSKVNGNNQKNKSKGRVSSPQVKESTSKKYKMKKKDYAHEEERESEKKSRSRSKDNSLSFKQALKDEPLLKKNQQDLGIMAMIKQNNKILNKYTVSPSINTDISKRLDTDIREYSSIATNPPQGEALKDYFTSGQENSGSNYNQDYRMPPLVANMNNLSSKISNDSNPNNSNNSNPQLEKKLSNKFNSQKQETQLYNKEESVEEIKSENSLEEDRSQYVSSRQQETRKENVQNYDDSQEGTVKSINYSVVSSRRPPQSIHISQTVESIDQSASKLIRPPLNKKRSTSRKKESSIVRTKFEKDSILQKPPNSSESQVNSWVKDDDPDIVVGKESLKFDSNVYDSEYEQSVVQKDLQKRISELQDEQKMRISQPQISINPPVIANTKSSILSIERNESKTMGGSKLKSLQEARNLAKQSKKKSINVTQEDQILKYQQKMSQLQSFLTKRDDSIINVKQTKQTKETRTIRLTIQKSPQQKKNIMNLLDELENQSSYKDDFQSYREESERY